MYAFKNLIGEDVAIVISRNASIPTIHVHAIRDKKGDASSSNPIEKPNGALPFQLEKEDSSYRKILLNVKG